MMTGCTTIFTLARGKSCLVQSVAKCGKVRQKLKKGGNKILYFKAARLSKTFKDNNNKTRKKKKINYFCTTNSTIEESSNLAESILRRAVNPIAVAKQHFLMK